MAAILTNGVPRPSLPSYCHSPSPLARSNYAGAAPRSPDLLPTALPRCRDRRTPQPAPGRRAQHSQHFSQAPAFLAGAGLADRNRRSYRMRAGRHRSFFYFLPSFPLLASSVTPRQVLPGIRRGEAAVLLFVAIYLLLRTVLHTLFRRKGAANTLGKLVAALEFTPPSIA
jgi:hypothetical protein